MGFWTVIGPITSHASLDLCCGMYYPEEIADLIFAKTDRTVRGRFLEVVVNRIASTSYSAISGLDDGGAETC